MTLAHAGTRQRLGHRNAVLQVRIHSLPRKGIAETVNLHSEPMHRIAIPRLGLLERLARHMQRLAHY